ncbi:MAG: hypothetical protein B0D96_00125 [Candidatus Sedimenticola endophacoides]|uniref:Haloacid dehalogenase n=1 Tax=Candidatus Sedimenticola endophacoides TaxID=2548426 RepID=A0A6N4DSH2_9GAMM|nr:MAG: hypothetical protein B0D94_11520 [Candidatus Sedimenticola endophacoides]OQX38413.1 MAG: hypothetical protein B0D89_12750 [Candidatus Sedimenticola endophacoides]OQX38495.1 MAG: hypothetical protein B0D96_00125 [Candidatus Sedimenticola endophacoides]OQX45329.1 MAG: hypothetical protein B0D88_00605 [Candidatus Sedimenticola endophacoides]PUD99934.1 MAG: haloacid dehalogenase [Candidatus Sedimenticola endophacoides]
MSDFTPARAIRAISFDLDDTLWDNRPVLLAAEQSLFDWLSAHYPRICARQGSDALRAGRLALARARPELAHDMTALRKAWLGELAQRHGYPMRLVEEAFAVFIEARHRVRLYDEVLPALQGLREAGFLLGALTNGNASIRRLGLDRLFDFDVNAAQAKATKPDPRVFRIACERAGVAPWEMLHVGDDPATDILGAHNAGVRTAWVNRSARAWPERLEPDMVVRDLGELLQQARRWRRTAG